MKRLWKDMPQNEIFRRGSVNPGSTVASLQQYYVESCRTYVYELNEQRDQPKYAQLGYL